MRRRRRQDARARRHDAEQGPDLTRPISDKRRLAPIHDRLKRAGARNVQVRTPKSIGSELDDLAGRMDLVLIDAPCTGTGTWRRNPDAKWRMRPARWRSG